MNILKLTRDELLKLQLRAHYTHVPLAHVYTRNSYLYTCCLCTWWYPRHRNNCYNHLYFDRWLHGCRSFHYNHNLKYEKHVHYRPWKPLVTGNYLHFPGLWVRQAKPDIWLTRGLQLTVGLQETDDTLGAEGDKARNNISYEEKVTLDRDTDNASTSQWWLS